MIEYKTRRRGSSPRRGDLVWIEGKVPDKPMAQGASGKVARIDWQERQAVVLLEGKQVTIELDELNSCWCDALNSYLIEEQYVQTHFNGSDTPIADGD